MDSAWATESLQLIRTLMERAALYRRALAPVMLVAGTVGTAGAAIGYRFASGSDQAFVGFWLMLAVAGLGLALLLVRRQALRASEPFWSPPTRRVAQAVIPPLFAGMVTGALTVGMPRWEFMPAWSLPAAWMLFYGCALNAAGFFMPRGIKLFGWVFLLLGTGLAAYVRFSDAALSLHAAHLCMGAAFGGLHLAYGLYLHFTEPSRA